MTFILTALLFWLGLGFSLSLPSFPPWLGALFNGFCQGFIIKIPSLNKTGNYYVPYAVGS
jgi:hypothetical protein